MYSEDSDLTAMAPRGYDLSSMHYEVNFRRLVVSCLVDYDMALS